MKIIDFVDKLPCAKKTSNGWDARCPAHDDGKASLSVAEGKNGRILVYCHAGCSEKSIVAALGLAQSDLFTSQSAERPKTNRRIVDTYPYYDEAGKLLFETVRFEPKDFSQRRPDPAKSGVWVWNIKGVQRVVYRFPDVIAAIAAGKTIFIAAGEKDVGALVEHGFVATCNPLGEKKDGSSWLPEYTKSLRGATGIVVIADKDETGRAHARAVATALRDAVSSLKVVELPDRGEARVKDAHDFFAAGGSADELRSLMESAPEFVSATQPPPANWNSAATENLIRDESESNDQDEQRRPVRKSAATCLVELASNFIYFHDAKNDAYVRRDVNGHIEIWPVYSKRFRDQLAQLFYARTGTAINRNALTDAATTLAGRACYDGPEEPVFLRVSPHGENILIDLCDPHWRVVEVTPNGWQVLQASPVAFIRSGAMRSLPEPTAHGSIEPLWDLLNVTPAQRPLVAGALLNYFSPYGPYFVTNFVGEQGTAKSCAAKILRLLIDPNETPLRSPPRTEQDLLVQAASNRCVALDNLSVLSPWLSDGLCRLSTGGGHSARSLYTDGDEFTLSVKRPVILNGIEDVAARPDLAERALQIELERIPDNRRILERELWRRLELALPSIFSKILDGLACALRELPSLKLQSLPRMADALEWVTAGETVFGWKRGTFAAEYARNLDDGATASVEAHPVGSVITQLLDRVPEWSGEPAQLLKLLKDSISDEQRHAREWPRNPRALSACLRRLAPALRRSGIGLDFTRSTRREIRLCRTGIFASQPSLTSPKPTITDAKDAKMQLAHDESIAAETEQEAWRL